MITNRLLEQHYCITYIRLLRCFVYLQNARSPLLNYINHLRKVNNIIDAFEIKKIKREDRQLYYIGAFKNMEKHFFLNVFTV